MSDKYSHDFRWEGRFFIYTDIQSKTSIMKPDNETSIIMTVRNDKISKVNVPKVCVRARKYYPNTQRKTTV